MSGGSLHQDVFPLPGGYDYSFDGKRFRSDTRDIMTYCAGQWMSDYTYENTFSLLQEFPTRELTDTLAGVSSVEVAGSINLIDNTADVSLTAVAPVGRTPAPTPGPYHIEFYDGSTKLSDVPFTPLGLGSHDSGGQEPPHAFIDETVALPAGADRLVIFDDRSGAEISSVAISGQPPIVSESSPADGDALPASGIVTVEWASGDADGDPVTHSVLYRAAASDPWTVLGAGLTGTSFDIDAAGLAGSVNAMIRVVAYDGFNESHDDVTGLDVPDKPSVVSIDAPADGTMITAGQPLQLSGSAAPVGGEEVPDAAFRWQSDLDGVLGIGPSLAANSLSVGTHILELRVTTQSGAAATATVTVVVFDDGEAPEVLDISTDELTFGGTSTSPPAPQSFEVFDQSGGSIPWTATSDNPNVLLSVGSGTTPATVAVSIDMGGIAGGDSLSGEITLQRSDGTGDPRVIDVRAESDLTPGSVAPISIDFGRQVQGTSGSPRTVTFTNNGGERITLGAAELAGAAPSEFSLPTDQCAGVPLSTGQSCAVGVTFGPSRAGRREAYLVLPDSDTDSAWYVSLTGLAHRQVAQPDGKLLGWGKNHAGQVGVVNTTPPCSAGIRCVPLLRDIGIADAIAATSNFFASAAITSDGTPLVWGTNCLGVFANGVYGNCATNVTTPQQPQYGRFSVEGLLTGVTDIAAGADHFVALRDDGSVVAWGSNSHAQVLGCGGGSSGAWISRAIPVRTTPCDTNLLVGVVAVAAGYQPDSFTSGSSYALKTDGTVVQWGATHGGSNSFGTLEPVQILGPGGAPLSGIVEIAAQMALHQNGTVWTWGEGLEGQLGNGQLSDPSGIPGDITAVQVLKPDGSGPLTEVKAIASFDRERYALTNDGRVLAWGSGAGDMDAGIALGIGGIRPAVTPLPTPVLAPGGAAPLTGVVDIAAGLARRPDGSVVAWGDARYGVLGDGTYFFNPWGNTVAIPPNPDAGPRWSVPVRGEGGNGFLTGTARLVGGLTRFALTGAPGGGGGGPTTLTAGSPVAVATTAGTALEQVIATFDDSLPTEAFAFSVNVDWGDDSEDSSAVVTGPDGGPYQIHGAHTYESAGDYELTIDVASRSGDSITLTGTANVDEVTLGALPARESPFVAGTTASHPLAGFTTPNRASDEASFHAMVDWGDGAPPEAALVLGPPGGPFDVVAEHAYRRADTDPYPLVLHVTDEDGAEITLPGTAIVTPASLVADATFGTDVLAGRSFSGSIARFRDGNPLSRATDYSALIRWGDEIETVGVLTGPDGGPYTVAGSHEYLGDGPFGVDVILNGPGTSASASTTLLQRQHRLRLTGSATPTGGAVPLDVTFTYVAHNDGANALWLVDVFGTSCGSAIRSGGDPNGNGVLDPGEAWAFTCERTFGQTGDVSDFAAATAYGLNDALGVRSNEVSTPISVGSGWPFSGFFQPVDNPPGVNVVKAGSTVPVKFGLGADRGLDIFASGFPASARTACDSGSLQDDLKQIAPPGAAALTYDATASRYHFNWKTVRSWAGTCRKLTLRFRLGGEQTALFRFK